MEKKNIIRLICVCVLVALAFIFIGRIAGGKHIMYQTENRGDLGPLSREDIVYFNV